MRLYPGDIGIEPRLDPPDEPDPLKCVQCEDEFWPTGSDESFWYCLPCDRVMGLDTYELREEVLYLEGRVAELERRKVLEDLEDERFRA